MYVYMFIIYLIVESLGIAYCILHATELSVCESIPGLYCHELVIW